MKYRYGGRERLMAFGVYPDVSLAQARKRREKAKALIRDGIDPNEVRRQSLIATATSLTNSFEAVAANEFPSAVFDGPSAIERTWWRSWSGMRFRSSGVARSQR